MSVNVQTVQPRKLAAVQRLVAPGEVGSAWGPAVGQVCDFGVEVTRIFETTGEVYATETPGGEAAVAVHRGPPSSGERATRITVPDGQRC